MKIYHSKMVLIALLTVSANLATAGQASATATASITTTCTITTTPGQLALTNNLLSLSTEQPGGNRGSVTLTLTGTGGLSATVGIKDPTLAIASGTLPASNVYYASLFDSSTGGTAKALSPAANGGTATTTTITANTTLYTVMTFPATATYSTGTYTGTAVVTCS